MSSYRKNLPGKERTIAKAFNVSGIEQLEPYLGKVDQGLCR